MKAPKFLRTLFLQNASGGCLTEIHNISGIKIFRAYNFIIKSTTRSFIIIIGMINIIV